MIPLLLIRLLMVGFLGIPSIGVSEMVWFAPRVDDTWESVWDGGRVAWLEETGWIDYYNVVLVSHDTGPLKEIVELEYGDLIYLYDESMMGVYEVVLIDIVTQQTLWPVMPTTDPTLTLIICYGDSRYIVQARQVEYAPTNAVG